LKAASYKVCASLNVIEFTMRLESDTSILFDTQSIGGFFSIS